MDEMKWLTKRLPRVEDRSLAAPTIEPTFTFNTGTAPLDVTSSNVLRVSDAYACVRLLADSVASLPLHAYRRTPAGRVRAGDTARIVNLLSRPSPGSTGVDLISQIMVHLNLYGDAFIGKYRADGEIVQLGLIPPGSVEVELRGQRVVYALNTARGQTEHGVEDVVHLKGMSLDGLRGLSPVEQCRVALGLSSSLQASARAFTEQGSRPSGILSAPSANLETIGNIAEAWHHRHGGTRNMHKVAVVSGDVSFTPLGFSQDDAQFLGQRELSAREVARIFRVPAWAIDAPTGDSLTYSNTLEQNRRVKSVEVV